MMVPVTGLTFLIGAVGFAFLTFRFTQYARREASTFSRVFLYFSASFLIFTLYTAGAVLFFYQSAPVLKSAVVVATLFQGIGNSFLAYLIFSLKVPNISPRLVFAFFLAATLATTLVAATADFTPRFDQVTLTVDWNVPAGQDVPRALMFFLTFLPMGAIFMEQFFKGSDPEVKQRALGLGVLMLLGPFAAAVDLVLEEQLDLGPAAGDVAQIVLYLVLLAFLVVTQKAPRPSGEL